MTPILYTGTHVLAIDGRSIRVTGQQTVMLATLASTPGATIPYDRLIRALWPRDEPDDCHNVIRVQMWRLRRAWPEIPLQNVRGAGYVLTERWDVQR
jgi:DNA-binding response OmpR family regulator